MAARARLFPRSTGTVSTWLQFAAATALMVAVAAGIDFANRQAGGALAARMLSAFVFALELCTVAGLAGSLLWFAKRAIVGEHAVQDFRDSVLWSACVIAGLVLLARIML